ncbi:unnamed protein product [Auanema sp. JU1783]|nr:unnamed protein product [Auanema sp. JU1783]
MVLIFKTMTGEEVMSEDEARKRREQLNRRPSYRMILKDIETVDKVLKKEPEETPPSSVDASPLQVHIPQTQAPARMPSGPPSYSSPLSGNLLSSGSLPSSLQLNGDLGQIPGLDFVAVVAAATSSHQQPTPVSSQPGGSAVLMGSDGHLKSMSMDGSFSAEWNSPLLSGYSSSPSPTLATGNRIGQGEDESSRKRQVRLLKNREAAKECRRKKKEYVKCLENRVSVLENQNKALIEELKTLKELYCRKEKSEM